MESSICESQPGQRQEHFGNFREQALVSSPREREGQLAVVDSAINLRRAGTMRQIPAENGPSAGRCGRGFRVRGWACPFGLTANLPGQLAAVDRLDGVVVAASGRGLLTVRTPWPLAVSAITGRR